jgi:hypothetical protein
MRQASSRSSTSSRANSSSAWVTVPTSVTIRTAAHTHTRAAATDRWYPCVSGWYRCVSIPLSCPSVLSPFDSPGGGREARRGLDRHRPYRAFYALPLREAPATSHGQNNAWSGTSGRRAVRRHGSGGHGDGRGPCPRPASGEQRRPPRWGGGGRGGLDRVPGAVGDALDQLRDVDLTRARPARLLDVVADRSASGLVSWMSKRDPGWRAGIHECGAGPLPRLRLGAAHRPAARGAGCSMPSTWCVSASPRSTMSGAGPTPGPRDPGTMMGVMLPVTARVVADAILAS